MLTYCHCQGLLWGKCDPLLELQAIYARLNVPFESVDGSPLLFKISMPSLIYRENGLLQN